MAASKCDKYIVDEPIMQSVMFPQIKAPQIIPLTHNYLKKNTGEKK